MLLSGILAVAIIALVLLPGPGQVRTYGSTARNLFILTEGDYLNPLLSTAKAVSILNCAVRQVAHFAGYDDLSMRIEIDNKVQIAKVTRYSGSLLSILEIRFARIEPATATNAECSIYITESFWASAFARKEDILGTTLRIQGVTYRIGGVTRDTSGLLADTDIWFAVSGRSIYGTMPCMRILGVLQPGTGWRAAQRELAKCFDEFLQDQPYAEMPGAKLIPVENSIYFREPAPSIASAVDLYRSSKT
jgi:hypothetical protein